MILLSGHSLTPARKVPVEAMSLQLKEKNSTATLTPADMTGITVGSWLLDDTEPGKGTVWRVRSISQAYATNTPTVQLEHAVNVLKDVILFGEITAATITGNSKATTCTAEQAVRYILNKSSDWVLGDFGYSVSNPYKFDGDTLYDALETVTDSLEDAWWSFDLSKYPFKLNITKASTTVGSELRAGRNLRTITRSLDRSGMYTRFYPIGRDDLHIDGDYVQKNTGTYGVVSHIETDASIDTKAELRRWANEKLNKHCEPVLTIDIEGLELSSATGEPLDKLNLGRVCRVPLPEYSTTIQERITSLSYPDKVGQPEVVRVTLSNERTDLTRILADAIKAGSTGKAGRTSTKRGKEDMAWFEDTNDHVAMCAKGIVGTDAKGNPNWVRLSQIIVDGTGIHQMVQGVQNDIVIANTKIDQNEHQISLEAQQRQSADSTLQGKITVEANRITQEVTDRRNGDTALQGKITVQANRITQEVTDRTNETTALKGQIITEAGKVEMVVTATDNRQIVAYPNKATFPATGDTTKIYLDVETKRYYEWKNGAYKVTTPGQKINAGGIVTEINNSGEVETRINSDKVYIGNSKSTTVINGKCKLSDVTAEYIHGKIAEMTSVQMLNATVTGELYVLNSASQSTSVRSMYDSVEKITSGNDITLKFTRLNGQSYASDSVTFSRAVTSLGYQWSSGKLTVTANPQGYSEQIIGLVVDGSWSGNTYNGKVKYYEGNDDEHTYDVPGLTFSVSRAVTSLGYSWSSGKLTVTANPQSYSQQLIGVTASGSWSGTTYNGKVKYYEGNDDSTTYNTGATFTIDASTKLETKSVSADGTYTPSSGKIGFSSFTVNGVSDAYKRGYVAGWNAYWDTPWYDALDSKPSGWSSHSLYVPNTIDSYGETVSYQRWTGGSDNTYISYTINGYGSSDPGSSYTSWGSIARSSNWIYFTIYGNNSSKKYKIHLT